MSDLSDLSTIIDAAWEKRGNLSPGNADTNVRAAVEQCIAGLDTGKLRVAEPSGDAVDGGWVVNEWLKKAVLLYFRLHTNEPIDAGYTQYFDKVPMMLRRSRHQARASFQTPSRAEAPTSPRMWS
jgi:2,3,4,5-tetrahydropyridine-2-carboxylate N-succinyltransferase